MTCFVGLDVSQKMTAVCVVDNAGHRLWRGQCPTVPEQISILVRRHAGVDARIGIETGAMTPWLVHKLRNLGLEVICLDARASSLLMESLADSSGAKFLIPFRRCFDGGTVMGRAYSQDLRKRQFSPSPKRPFATLLHERLMHSSKPSLKRSQTSHPASAQIISQTRAMAANHENALAPGYMRAFSPWSSLPAGQGAFCIYFCIYLARSWNSCGASRD